MEISTLSFLLVILTALVAVNKQIAETYTDSHSQTEKLDYNYYVQTCPFAESIIRSTVQELYQLQPEIAPALLRIVFHDCFVHGCDASILLNSTYEMRSEQLARPNKSLKKLDVISTIKSRLEESCPGVVSCADIVVLAARESVVVTGGPYYPLPTGRRDSTDSYFNETKSLPSPHGDLRTAIASFAAKGFDARELVTLLGAHSTGTIHCEFIRKRLDNFKSTGEPDPSIDLEFLEILRAKCNGSDSILPVSNAPSSSASPEDPGVKMDYNGPGNDFGKLYYQSLLLNKGLLFVDQQLTSSEETATWVRAYATDISLFQRDFAIVMNKMSNLQVLTAPEGQIWRDCTKAN